LLDSLELDDANLKISTLDTFRMAVADAPEIISQHVRRLVPALLQVAQHSKQMAVRISALMCLAQFPVSLTRDVLQPHCTYTIKQLSLCLDDNKRLVRRQAVDCRSKWYVLPYFLCCFMSFFFTYVGYGTKHCISLTGMAFKCNMAKKVKRMAIIASYLCRCQHIQKALIISLLACFRASSLFLFCLKKTITLK
jgi:hypothetical protein